MENVKKPLSIQECAKIMGVSCQMLRTGLIQGIFKFGVAIKKPNSSKYHYVIYPNEFLKLYGNEQGANNA